MKAFAKNRKSKAAQDGSDVDGAPDGLDLADLDLGSDDDTLEDDPISDDGSDDFLERLGDLDRFIGSGITGPTPVTRAGGPAAADERSTRRLFDARDHAVAVAEPPAEQSEADEFLERLGDLDRFVGGDLAPATTWLTQPVARNFPTPEPDEDPADSDWEPPADDGADDFMQRLGDLDRFIGGDPAS